jgi:hypothetical protein
MSRPQTAADIPVSCRMVGSSGEIADEARGRFSESAAIAVTRHTVWFRGFTPGRTKKLRI